jgi:hypothetical protein
MGWVDLYRITGIAYSNKKRLVSTPYNRTHDFINRAGKNVAQFLEQNLLCFFVKERNLSPWTKIKRCKQTADFVSIL